MQLLLRRREWFLCAALICVFTPSLGYAENEESHIEGDHQHENQGPPVKWQAGPSMASLGDIAEIKVPAKYQFTGREDAQRLMKAMGNPVNGEELGLVTPADEKAAWFVVFEFSDTGYVKDDEKDKLDAAAILEAIRKGTASANEERQKNGWPQVEVLGWLQAPMYDPKTHYLQWAIRGKSGEDSVVNYNTRILGRNGVMSVGLVADPSHLEGTLPAFNSLVSGFQYKTGKRYAEFVQGDKVAQYGLTALVAGGAAAVLVKTGLFKKLWKGIVLGIVALLGVAKRFFGKKKQPAAAGSEPTNV